MNCEYVGNHQHHNHPINILTYYITQFILNKYHRFHFLAAKSLFKYLTLYIFTISSGIPILTGDHDYEQQQQQGSEQDDYLPAESAGAVHDISKRADFDTDDYADLISIDGGNDDVTAHLIRKRQTWVFVTHNTLTNDSQYREFKFEQVIMIGIDYISILFSLIQRKHV